MKKYLMSVPGLLIVALLLSQVTIAQDKNEKTKMGDKDEIIIKRKDGKNTKITIEIKDDQVLVNGKPYDEYKDDDITIRKRRNVVIATPRSPFRGQGGTYSFDSQEGFFGMADDNVAFLGVVSEKNDKGALIEQITKESSAEKAGLKKGDIITKVDDSKIEDPEDLTKAIRKHKPEEKATIAYLRDGKENKLTVTLGKRNNGGLSFAMPRTYVAPDMNMNWDNGLGDVLAFAGRPRLGIQAQDTEEGKGVKVIDIDDESPAEKAGIKEGDVITEFDGEAVNSAEELARAARSSKDKSTFKIKLLRDGKAQTIEVKIPKKLNTANL
jgi:serine protease Do